MTSDSNLDRLVRAADPVAGRPAPAVDDSPHALATIRAGLTRPAGRDGVVRSAGRPEQRARGWVAVAASVAAVVAVVGLAATALDSGPGASGQPGSGPQPSAGLTTAPSGGDTEPGQREHTASAGPEDERGRQLLATLQGFVPDGYTVPDAGTGHPDRTGPTSGPGVTMPTIGPDGTGMPATYYEVFRDRVLYQGFQGDGYTADTIVSRGRQVGSLQAQVWVEIPAWSTDPCVLVDRVYGNGISCRVLTTAGGRRVAVFNRPRVPVPGQGTDDPGLDPRNTQSAAYRHADGTMVVVAQGPGVLNRRIPRLDRPVFTAQQLATLATAESFPAAVA
jgi:hypothetical protein